MPLSRRDVLASAAAGLAVAATPRTVSARSDTPRNLFVDTRQIEVLGKPARRFGVFQKDGTPGITLDEGDVFDIDLVNRLDQPTLVHWHGFVEPWRQDGVPNLSSPPIAAGASRRFMFPAKPTGTRWMHSHFGLQEQNLLSAPFIVRETSAIRADAQEVVMMLDDFTWRAPDEVFHGLRTAKMSMGKMDDKDSGPDLNDVDFDAALANDRTLDAPEIVRTDAGGRVRLRIINAAASSNFTVDLGETEGTLIAVDGTPVEPVAGRRFPIAIAQRLDIMVTMPSGGGTIPVIAGIEGTVLRAGLILATRGATVKKLPVSADNKAARVTLDLEKRLRAAAPLDGRATDRRFVVDLTGTMQGYVWNMAVDGLPGLPVSALPDERIEVEMRNKTPMAHPMHLHGHLFQVIGINGTRFSGALRDSVLVPPQSTVTFAFDAGNPGLWAFHCHNLYHLAAGMFSTLVYRNIT